jgi:hypothetical protein
MKEKKNEILIHYAHTSLFKTYATAIITGNKDACSIATMAKNYMRYIFKTLNFTCKIQVEHFLLKCLEEKINV